MRSGSEDFGTTPTPWEVAYDKRISYKESEETYVCISDTHCLQATFHNNYDKVVV